MLGETPRTMAWSVAVLLACGSSVTATTAGDTLWIADWTLATPLGDTTGKLLYLTSPANGAWRCEIAVDEGGAASQRDDLLRRRGTGWTVTAGPNGGFVQSWDEAWQSVGSGTLTALQGLLAVWVREEGPAGGDADPGRWRRRETGSPVSVAFADWHDLPAAWRPPDEESRPGGHLRRQLAARGRGRGGPGVVLRLLRSGRDLVVTSTRWPGRLTLAGSIPEDASVPEEAFLPLWPLAEFYD